MLGTVLAGLRYRKARLMLSAACVAIGVAFVAGTLLLNASMSASFFGTFAVSAQNVSAVVAGQKSGDPPGQFGGQTVPRAVLGTVRAAPGVADAEGRVIGPASIPGTGQAGYGINVTSLGGFTLAAGHRPVQPGQVDVDKSTATDRHYRLGQPITVIGAGGTARTFTLAGIIDVGVNAQFGNGAVLAFQTATAFAVTGQSSYTMIVARAAPGVTQQALAASLAQRLKGYQVETGSQYASEEANAATHVSDVFGTGLLIFALVSLVVACLVIYNTFSMLLAQRTREFALLRCTGATRRQVFRGILGEAAVTGLAASAAGLLAGIGVAAVLGRLIRPRGAGPAPLVLQPAAIAIAVATGVVVTVAAALIPARAATRIAPVAAVSGAGADTVTRTASRLRVAVAIATGTLGLLITAAGLRAAGANGGGPAGLLLIAAGGCVFFLAVLAAGPLIAPPLIALFALPFRRTTARLAVTNATRNPHRVAATSAALTIGITLMTLFTVVLSSVQVATGDAITGHFPFDYIVAAPGDQVVPPDVIAALRTSPGLAMVAAQYGQPASVGREQEIVGAFDHDALGVAVKPAMVAGRLTAVGPGTAAVAGTTDETGKTITVGTPDAGRLRLRIVAVFNPNTYKTPVPSVLMSVPDFVRGFRPAGASQVVIDAAAGVSPAASRAAVSAAIAADPLLSTRTLADYKAELNHGVDSILELVAALVALAILIALGGIASTLTLSVIERTRESALMRALGLTRGQLRRMLLAEAVLMAAVAVLLGTALGTGFGAAIVHGIGHGTVTLAVPVARLALYAAIALLAGAAAAVLPARRAARTDVVQAISAT